jgi:hypothetical protein
VSLDSGSPRYLRDGHNRLDVVNLEVALEVEDSHLLTIADLEKAAKRGIRVDVLLVVERVLLHVVHDATGHIGAAELRALGLAKEYAEVVRDLLGLRENGGLLGEGVARLVKLGRPRAATATSLLELTRKALLGLLHVGEHGAERLAEVINLRDVGGELGNEVHLLLSNRGGGNRGGNDSRNRGGRRSSAGSRLAASGGRRGAGGSSRGGGGNYRLGSLRGLLSGGSLLLGRIGAHFILVSGLI